MLVITNWYASLAVFYFIHFAVSPLISFCVFCVGVQLYTHACYLSPQSYNLDVITYVWLPYPFSPDWLLWAACTLLYWFLVYTQSVILVIQAI